MSIENDGITLPCPRGGEEDAVIKLDLSNGELYCDSCGEVFTVEQVQTLIHRWNVALEWIGKRPRSLGG